MQSLIRFALTCIIGGGACGDSYEPVVVHIPDATPNFIAYKTPDSSAWVHPAKISPSDYTVNASGDYDFLMVCVDGAGSPDLELIRAAAGDGDQTVEPLAGGGYCSANTSATLGRVHGNVTHAGQVWIGDFSQLSFDEAWSYDFQTNAGLRDVVATPIQLSQGVPMVAIRRAVDVAPESNTELAALDITSGLPLSSANFIQNSESDEAVSATVSLVTVNQTMADLSYSGGVAYLAIDPTALEPGDIERLDVTAKTATSTRKSQVNLRALAATEVHLLPLVQPIFVDTAAGVTVHWSDALGDGIGMVISFATTKSNLRLKQTAARLLGHSTLDVSVDVIDPAWNTDWQPAWFANVDSTERQFSTFSKTESTRAVSTVMISSAPH
jgi:hypothetical protein